MTSTWKHGVLLALSALFVLLCLSIDRITHGVAMYLLLGLGAAVYVFLLGKVFPRRRRKDR